MRIFFSNLQEIGVLKTPGIFYQYNCNHDITEILLKVTHKPVTEILLKESLKTNYLDQ